jgi:tRNA-(ms[2]io[6]A)-hydroxylase
MTVAGYRDLLGCDTPEAWLAEAGRRRDVLLIDHANCEKKAAGTALSLIYRYNQHAELLQRLSRLAREELRHFEQVLSLMQRRCVEYRHLSPSRYAAALRSHVRTHEPGRLVDTLLVGALVEARSCERFEKLAARFDDDMGALYRRLLESEARHAQHYLHLAQRVDDGALATRLATLRVAEAALIETPDPDFRFHSGMPA